MKIVILAAGKSEYFPLFIDKPKCLYHFCGEIQLERVIKVALKFVSEQDIIIVAGYKYKYIESYLKTKHPSIDFRINNNYNGPAVYSLRVASQNLDDDILFVMADENISEKNISRLFNSNKKFAILCHKNYYYYSLGIFKIKNDCINYIFDDCYLSMNYFKKIYCFANNKKVYDGTFNINSGICMGYLIIDLVRRIGNIIKIEDPMATYKGNDIDFLYYDVDKEYIKDIDTFADTDEYSNIFMKLYYLTISKILKKFLKLFNIIKTIK